MTPSLLIAMVVIIGWSLVAGRLERWRVPGPLLMVVAGIAVGFSTRNEIGNTLNTVVAERAVELILALLLFVDATEIKGGYFGGERAITVRLLCLALPLSLVAATVVGMVLLPDLPIAVLLIIACVVVPTDFSPASSILRDKRLPARVRHVINIESGYNDGIVAPVFVFALTLAGDHEHAETPGEALESAVPAAAFAILAGAAVGLLCAWLTNTATRRDLATAQSLRIGIVVIPILAYGCAIAMDGNGFVAAFISGIAYRAARSDKPGDEQLGLLDEVGVLTGLVMWFVFGSTAVLLLSLGVEWMIVLYVLIALTLVRLIPVYLALIGSSLSRPNRLLVGVLGPRGTASIVFGLLAYNALEDEFAGETLYAMIMTVLGSLVIHGVGSSLIAQRLDTAATRTHTESGQGDSSA
jgi:NhaP-type Na+/H+ or K+/H+ antiporter